MHFESTNYNSQPSSDDRNIILAYSSQNNTVLMSTVSLTVIAKNWHKINCRALLENGSQSNFLTYKLFEKLGLSKEPTHMSVVGIGNVGSNIWHECNLNTYHNKSEQLSNKYKMFFATSDL